MTTEVVSLEDAVRAAVEQGHTELTRLDEMTAELVEVFRYVQRGTEAPSDLIARLDEFAREFPEELRRHLDRERSSLRSFNIAFFGRTGVGKSTLLSAFGRLDGEYVSPGASDWTTDVQPIEWRDCRLFDTPGINGWGRTESRSDLEAKARQAVEIADIVLLCFDNQSQQEMEFEKIAAWIRDHGKPVVAVLNVKNPEWRHPARVPAARRNNSAEAVRQHTDNIRTQLTQIGLPDTPIVAIHSQRALFARATTPFHGPAVKGFEHERKKFGTEYLDRWSNFGTLERLIVTSITEGSAELRLAALRDDIRSRCRHAIEELEALAVDVEQEAGTREREIESLFAAVGYPEDSERAKWLHDAELGGDLVELSEKARGRPYTSPPKGALDRYVRYLTDSHLAGPRSRAKANADELIRSAFAETKAIDESEFTKAVFDDASIAAAAAAVWSDRRGFLQRELEVAADHASTHDRAAVARAATILGDEGKGLAGAALRGGGIAVGAGVLLVPALANFWNPGGWALGLIAAGIGIAGQVQQHFGKRMSEQESARARQARAQAIADCHRAVDRTFAEYEDTLVHDSRDAAWTLLAPVIGEMLRAAIDHRMTRGRIARLINGLQSYSGSIAPAPAATDVLARAQRRMGDSPAEITRTLLGEDWLESVDYHQAAPIDDATCEAYSRRRDEDRARLTQAMVTAWNTPSMADIHSWRDELEDAARLDPALFDIAQLFWRVESARPALTVLGDYNSGKSSLIRRIVIDAGRQPHAPFDIRALPATATANRYELPGFDLIDTPGLQSGHRDHAATTLDAVTGAALVFVVVHINLLVGSSAILEELARGSDTIAAKGGRMVFLVNRCDELGVDPLTAHEAFLNLQDRKRDELRAAFAARSVDIEVGRIHCLSGDPFGMVGSDHAAEPCDFDENRPWDGVAALTESISGLSDEQLSAASRSAALDAAVTALKRHQRTIRQVQADAAETLRSAEPVTAALRAAVTDAAILESSLREDARWMVDRHVVAAKTEVAQVDHRDGGKIEDLVTSWWKTPRFEADLENYLADAARVLDEWHSDHMSAISREMRAAEFRIAPEYAVQFKAQGNAWFEDVAQGAGYIAGVAAPLAKALGNRNAVYAIGKQLGHKFRPWGAVRGGANVARAGVVLGAVAAAVDVASMANDMRKADDHKRQQESAEQAIDQAAAEIVEQILRGEDETGPLGYLTQLTTDLEALLDENLARESSARERMDAAKAEADVAGALIASADDLISQSGRKK